MHQFHFIIPDPSSFPSGGNNYNAHLIDALIQSGAHVSHSVLHPEIMLSSPDTVYILDSIYFDKVSAVHYQIPQNCIGLIHHLESLFPLSPKLFTTKEKPLLERFSSCLVTSMFTARYLTDHGYDPARVCMIEPAPLLHRHEEHMVDSRVNGLLLGSCIPRKGQLEFLEALAVSSIPPEFKLVIAGSHTPDPDYAAKCRDVVAKSPLLTTCVQFLGEQDTAAIARLYATSNLFLSTSHMETFGMAIQDAVSCGMPVLALEGGYAAEHVFHGINGYRCNTVHQLVSELSRCVKDPDHFEALTERAMQFSPPYHTWEEGAQQFLHAYGNLPGLVA